MNLNSDYIYLGSVAIAFLFAVYGLYRLMRSVQNYESAVREHYERMHGND